MKVTKLLLLVVETIHELSEQERLVTAQSVADELGVKWRVANYLKKMRSDNIIAPFAGSHKSCYTLTSKGEKLYENNRGHVDSMMLKDACREYQALLTTVELQEAIEILQVVKDLNKEDKQVWPGLIAGREGKRKPYVCNSMQKFEEAGLLVGRFETKQEAFAEALTRPRHLYRLSDAGEKFLETFI